MVEGFQELEVECWTFRALDFTRQPDGRLVQVVIVNFIIEFHSLHHISSVLAGD